MSLTPEEIKAEKARQLALFSQCMERGELIYAAERRIMPRGRTPRRYWGVDVFRVGEAERCITVSTKSTGGANGGWGQLCEEHASRADAIARARAFCGDGYTETYHK